jgi:hypothetical protein
MAPSDPPKLEYARPDSQPRFWEPDIGWPLFIIGCLGAVGLVIALFVIALYVLTTW